MYLIKNTTLFNGETLQENKNVLVAKDKIIDVLDSDSSYSHNVKEVIEGCGHILAPGFIDIQVNGGGGVFFNETPTPQALKIIHDTHLKFGTTSLLPTLISDTFEKTKRALHAVSECIKESIVGIVGIHLEGPYLNSQKNGIHNKTFLRPPILSEIEEICTFPLPVKLMTFAPELMPKEFLDKIIAHKIILFAGHTNATFQEMMLAFENGVCGITHFFNACSPFLSRAPGVVGAGLWHDGIWCGLIADGLHVSYDAIKITFKTKTPSKFILVSDAMSAVGTTLSEFDVHGQKIYVKENKYEDEHGTLAGSSLTMLQALKNIVFNNCASLEKALAMTSTNPAKCLQIGHKKGKVLPNYDADLVLLDKDNLNLVKVIQAGVLVQ